MGATKFEVFSTNLYRVMEGASKIFYVEILRFKVFCKVLQD